MLLSAARIQAKLMALSALMCLAAAHTASADGPCAHIAINGAPQLALDDLYEPFAATNRRQTTALQIINEGDAPCALALVFVSPSEGALQSGSHTLTYGIETADGAPLLNGPNVIDPLAANHIGTTLSGGETAAIPVRMRVHAGQKVRPGAYADPSLTLRLYAITEDGPSRVLDEKDVPVSAQVAPVCIMSAPQPDTLDFSSDIAFSGRPRGQWRSLQLPQAACNTSAKLKLTGAALAITGHEIPSGFDGFIDLEAQAVFESGAATLVTDGADSPEQASSSNIRLKPGEPHPINVQLRLRAGRPLAAGDYESVLTIALEPSP